MHLPKFDFITTIIFEITKIDFRSIKTKQIFFLQISRKDQEFKQNKFLD